MFEKSGSGVYQKPTIHSHSRNTGQEWSEVINDGLMFRTVYVRSCEDRSDSRAAFVSWTVSFALTSGANLRPT